MSSATDTTSMLDGLITQQDATAALRDMGISAPDIEHFDFRALLLALDGLFVVGFGTAALAGFMKQPHPSLAWKSPSEAILEPDGLGRVRRVIHTVAMQA